MPIFTSTGDHHLDLWLVDGSPNFSIFPAGIVPELTTDTPIRLKVGNPSFGATHIQKHARWYRQNGFKSAPELVFFKLSQPGMVYCTEKESKIKIMMRLKPSALLVLDFFDKGDPHLSVTTIYYNNSTLDGELIGRYPGRLRG